MNLLTHVMEATYAGPEGFDWESNTKAVTPSNIELMATNLVAELRAAATAGYRTNVLLQPFGGDFHFVDAKSGGNVGRGRSGGKCGAGSGVLLHVEIRFFNWLMKLVIWLHPHASSHPLLSLCC